jgi:hypothetical protein
MGSVYKQSFRNKKGELHKSQVWWVKYYKDGKSFRESSKSKRKLDAERLLKRREGEIVNGEFQGLRVGRITFDELAQDLINDYKINTKSHLIEQS